VTREELEHVIAAAANIVGEDEFVVIGSQAILGSHPNAPEEMLRSMEADIYPARDPERAIAVDGNLGDGSRFHLTYGYYAHGIGPETAKAPYGWQDRLIRVPIPARVLSRQRPVALFLEPHDLVLAKCVAGRQRDWDYARHALRCDLVQIGELLERIPFLPVPEAQQEQIRLMLTSIADPESAAGGKPG